MKHCQLSWIFSVIFLSSLYFFSSTTRISLCVNSEGQNEKISIHWDTNRQVSFYILMFSNFSSLKGINGDLSSVFDNKTTCVNKITFYCLYLLVFKNKQKIFFKTLNAANTTTQCIKYSTYIRIGLCNLGTTCNHIWHAKLLTHVLLALL